MSQASETEAVLPKALLVAGAGMLVATGAIHLDLYMTGYRQIPTIGWLFVLQVISAFALAAGCLVSCVVVRRVGGVRGVSSDRLVALSGAGFAAATLAGYLVSLRTPLFGFQESRTNAGITAGIIEVAIILVLGMRALSAGAPAASRRSLLAVPAAIVAAVLFVLAEAASGGGAVAAPAGGAGGGSGGTHAGGKVAVDIKNFMFVPMSVKVTPGEKISVKNEDSVAHTLTGLPGSPAKGKFDTGSVGPGQTVTITAPGKPGRYPFFCMIHQYMTGTLTVS